ncbi:MAG: hypothetical protein LQ347_002196 [Umbilicaria vellea]|nr:MAG: hypothetical protein LQ347_002196 [Umbilicaria vellea]
MDHHPTDPTDTAQQGPQFDLQHSSEASDLPQLVSQAGNVLEVDSEGSSLSASTLQDDRDSAYGDTSDVDSAFTSISSSVRDYRKENGRTYHAYKDGSPFLLIRSLGRSS